MKSKNLVFIFLILISGSMYSQVTNLNGQITSVEDIELEGLNIQNLSRSRGTITNNKGEFRIVASIKDTLAISALHIQTIILIVDEENINKKSISINLIEKLNELEAVNLRRTALTGYIGADLSSIPTKVLITASSLGLPNADLPRLTKSQRELYAANSGGLNQLINIISGKTKSIKMGIELHNKQVLTLQLLDKFPETYFTQSLKINKDQVYSFLFFCEDDAEYEVVLKQSNLRIIKFLERKSLQFHKSLVEEG